MELDNEEKLPSGRHSEQKLKSFLILYYMQKNTDKHHVKNATWIATTFKMRGNIYNKDATNTPCAANCVTPRKICVAGQRTTAPKTKMLSVLLGFCE